MKLKNLYYAVPILFCSIALFLHGYLGHFSRYIADDFCTAFYAHRLGVLRATWFWYLNWSGRFSASVFDALVGLFGPRVVPIVVPLTILIWLIVLTTIFLHFLQQLQNRALVSLSLAIISLFTLFLLAPDIRQSLYWGQGMRSVIPPLIMCTIQIIFLNHLRSRNWTKVQLGLWGTLSFVWAFVTGGFSETYAALQVGILLLFLLIILIVENFKMSTTSLFLATGLLGASSAMVAIILAPGNSARQAFYPPPPGISGILTISIKSYLLYVVSLVNAIDKILGIVGFFSFAMLVGAQYQPKVNAGLLPIILIITLGSTFICFPPAAYGISDTPPARTLILPTYFFLAGLLGMGFVSGNLLERHRYFIPTKYLLVLMSVAVIASASIDSVKLYQSRSEFVNYATIWDRQDADITTAKRAGAAQIRIPSTPNWASLNTPNDNPKFWVNVCMSSYYGIQVVAPTDALSPTP